MSRIGVLVLAAGKGTRMNSAVPKQFLEINGKPIFMHSSDKFLDLADVVCIVTDEEHVAFMQALLEHNARMGKNNKNVIITCGGRERWQSSVNGLRALDELGGCDYVLIHDAARCLVDRGTIERVLQDTITYGAAVAAVPSKDTIKIAGEDGFVASTPDREKCWIIQTPQGFSREIITEAYQNLIDNGGSGMNITDDAMVVENFSHHPVRLTMGSYENIKVTTPEDLIYVKEKLK